MDLLHFTRVFYRAVGLSMALLYFYQVLYLAVGLLHRPAEKKRSPVRLRRYAVLISARNEEGVIGELIASLKRQNYPARLLDIYVVADNCTDSTAAVARAAGARVYTRFDREYVGKGYALDFLLRRLASCGLEKRYDGYFIFDADNIVDPNFVSEMNRVFDRGDFDAVTSYRNSKNFGQNWITAGYSIWFLREAQFINAARMALGVNCAVSGTGFLVSARLLREKGGWPYHLLTEDIQFSADCALHGWKIGYCGKAVLYDEQPVAFQQAWDQRLRWSKGFYQVDRVYGSRLFRGIFRGGRYGWSCCDILLTVMPGVLLVASGAALLAETALACLAAPDLLMVQQVLSTAGACLLESALSFYRGMLLYGLITVLTQWKHIRSSAPRKLLYLLTFPLFILTYIPVTAVALFQKVEWKPIRHNSLTQIGPAA